MSRNNQVTNNKADNDAVSDANQREKERTTQRPASHGPFRRGGPGQMLGVPAEKPKNFGKSLKRLLAYVKPYRVRLMMITLFAIIGTVFSIVSPRIMGEATTVIFDGLMQINAGIPGAHIDFQAVGRIVLLLIGLYVISASFEYLQHFMMAEVAQRTVYTLRKEVSEKLTKLPLSFFDGRPYGDVLSRITNDVDNISNTLQQSLMQLITSVVTLLGVVIMMLTISPIITLVTLVTLPLSVYVTMFVAKRSQPQFRGQQKWLGELSGHVEEMYNGHKIVKAFGREKTSIKQFESYNHNLYESGWKAQFISGLIWPLMQMVNNIGYIFVAVAGGVMVARGSLPIGHVQASIQYARQFGMPIMQVASIANIIQSTIASAERVFDVLDEEEEVPTVAHPVKLTNPKGKVEFHDVDFSYDPQSPLIEGMNLVGYPGQIVAIVGPTGAGKTTLVNLLMRFYEIQGGSITIDGVDIRDMDRKDLRLMFGMVLQDTWLFNGTIGENIAYGLEDATMDQVVAAAKAAHADHFIRTLPDGYDTILNEDASNISQGQKQLLTIARAILADPTILILDEATSSVDTRTELLIQEAMRKLMEGRTSFVIAHRLSTIENADLILVMNEGTFVEKGTHKQLLAQDGFYADLYNSQFAGAAPATEVI